MSEIQKRNSSAPSLAKLLNDDAFKTQLAAALPKHMTPERMARLALTALRTTPKLAECSQMSFAGEIMKLAQLGLEPNTPLGHAYLIPRNNRRAGGTECTTVIGYQGYIELARRAGTLVYAHVVYEGDIFEFELGLTPKLRHVPMGKTDTITHAYAVARPKGSEPIFEVLPLGRIEERRKRGASGSGSKTPWDTDYAAMARKTAIRAIWYALPKSTEMLLAAEMDADNERVILEAAQRDEVVRDAVADLNAKILGAGSGEARPPMSPEDIAEREAIEAEASQ